ncbi:MAG: aminotransferase class I/II-fold pyridoxal phosphate-dependent enzyme, partial [Acidimicrobiales bacterium]|nr:aminotransferase class I/II-fold pyridoxal phosphate-dependent enzyme [Acidimicrobiales bacterium]
MTDLSSVGSVGGFVPPPYPYDRLNELRAIAERHPGGCVDLSVGTPTDPAPDFVVAALADPATINGYPLSAGSDRYRDAAAGWVGRRFGVDVDSSQLAACVGTKEFVTSLPHWLRLRLPDRDTVLYPAVSYPSYAMGAMLAGCRALPVEVDERGRLLLDTIDDDDIARALCVWVNSPGNPAGGLEDLGMVAKWGRERDVLVASDECYVEFTWNGAGHSILEHGVDGVLAVHSLSKRSNLAGARVGFYAGDRDLVAYLLEVRKHAGLMVPGPVQAAAALAWSDDEHVEQQRARYRARLSRMVDVLGQLGIPVSLPDGGFYLWVRSPSGDGWELARRLAQEVGVLASPGEFYGDAARSYCRIAVVQSDRRIDLVEERVAAAVATAAARHARTNGS